MTQAIQIGDPPIDVHVRRSARAKRLSLRVSGLDGKVSLTLPLRARLREAQAFAEEKEPWIRKHLERHPGQMAIGPGALLPVEGVMRQITPTPRLRRVQLQTDALLVPVDEEKITPRVRAFLKTLARDRLSDASARYAQAFERNFGKITLRDTRSRWGSCTSQGNLMYSWRLIMAPPEVLDYVAAHEVAHLLEMNHSARFWARVEQVMPGYKTPRRWLKQNGATLHAYML